MKLAFDRATLRTIDQDGRMHVELSNISKACVNPYRGSEIPNSEALGLEPDRVYYLLRDPAELEKAAATFNNIPLLNRHIPVSVDEPQKEYVVGSTGTDAVFADPYLRQSLVVWDAVAIAGVNTKQQTELSCSYRYDADMTPGKYAGVAYDGIMRNIRGNHVALVEVGRAGPDVVVGDSKLNESKPKMKKTAHALAVQVALMAALPQVLAADAKMADLSPVIAGVKSIKTKKARADLLAHIKRTQPLAADADLSGLVELLDAIGEEEAEEVKPGAAVAVDGTPSEQLQTLLAGAGLSPDVLAQVKAICEQMTAPVAAADTEEKEPGITKAAMDAAIRATETATVKRMNAIHTAVAEVAPLIGTVVAQDSAEAVYKLALDAKSIDVTDVHPSAYRAMVGLIAKAAPIAGTPKRMASDAASVADFNKMFPNASKMKGVS